MISERRAVPKTREKEAYKKFGSSSNTLQMADLEELQNLMQQGFGCTLATE